MQLIAPDLEATAVRTNPVALFNAPVLTDFGQYELSPISVLDAAELIAQRGYFSAIGHRAGAELFSRWLQIDCPMNRVRHIQRAGEDAIVLRLGVRLAEGCVLQSVAEIEALEPSLALLRKLS